MFAGFGLPKPGVVTPARTLDFDHLRAHVAEYLCAKRPRNILREI